jgi:hypothetical protein
VAKRKQISKRTRFEIFKRDNFACVYCGRKPPDVILEIDHLHPHSKGGHDKMYNLVTSCFDCNRGKSNTELTDLPPKLLTDFDEKKEKQSQIDEYRKFIDDIEKKRSEDMDRVDAIYNKAFQDWCLSENFRNKTLKRFLAMLPFHEVESAMSAACSKMYHNEDKAIKYFCGICWGKFDSRNNV